MYKYSNYDVNPNNGYYGWYVYGIINHGLNLSDDKHFIVEFIDLDNIDTSNLDNNLIVLRFARKRAYPQFESIDSNTMIVHGMYKPDIISRYIGGKVNQSIIYLDDAKTMVRTNLIYYYTIKGV